MAWIEQRAHIIKAVADEQDVEPELLDELLKLEISFRNLHIIGVQAQLKRAAENLIDAAIERQAARRQ